MFKFLSIFFLIFFEFLQKSEIVNEKSNEQMNKSRKLTS